jgi:hypothetical protein
MEFFRIIQPLQPILNFTTFDINELFKELDDGWDFIAVKKFNKIYADITSKIPFVVSVNQASSKELEAKRLEQEKERKNKIIKSGFQKLQTYMQ